MSAFLNIPNHHQQTSTFTAPMTPQSATIPKFPHSKSLPHPLQTSSPTTTISGAKPVPAASDPIRKRRRDASQETLITPTSPNAPVKFGGIDEDETMMMRQRRERRDEVGGGQKMRWTRSMQQGAKNLFQAAFSSSERDDDDDEGRVGVQRVPRRKDADRNDEGNDDACKRARTDEEMREENAAEVKEEEEVKEVVTNRTEEDQPGMQHSHQHYHHHHHHHHHHRHHSHSDPSSKPVKTKVVRMPPPNPGYGRDQIPRLSRFICVLFVHVWSSNSLVETLEWKVSPFLVVFVQVGSLSYDFTDNKSLKLIHITLWQTTEQQNILEITRMPLPVITLAIKYVQRLRRLLMLQSDSDASSPDSRSINPNLSRFDRFFMRPDHTSYALPPASVASSRPPRPFIWSGSIGGTAGSTQGLASLASPIGEEAKVLSISLILAQKYSDDAPYGNRVWGQIVGLVPSTLSYLEARFLSLIGFNLYVNEAEYISFCRGVQALAREWNRALQTQGQLRSAEAGGTCLGGSSPGAAAASGVKRTAEGDVVGADSRGNDEELERKETVAERSEVMVGGWPVSTEHRASSRMSSTSSASSASTASSLSSSHGRRGLEISSHILNASDVTSSGNAPCPIGTHEARYRSQRPAGLNVRTDASSEEWSSASAGRRFEQDESSGRGYQNAYSSAPSSSKQQQQAAAINAIAVAAAAAAAAATATTAAYRSSQTHRIPSVSLTPSTDNRPITSLRPTSSPVESPSTTVTPQSTTALAATLTTSSSSSSSRTNSNPLSSLSVPPSHNHHHQQPHPFLTIPAAATPTTLSPLPSLVPSTLDAFTATASRAYGMALTPPALQAASQCASMQHSQRQQGSSLVLPAGIYQRDAVKTSPLSIPQLISDECVEEDGMAFVRNRSCKR
ncbi:hypothetical protein HDU97_002086 [Phlyctochytrium planicorne]|nr:hypothetical protein HDU97_002086 [Phlyctochytrium planicorne]